jgi:polyphosphate glucokinase
MVYSAANVDSSWIGTDGQVLFQRRSGCPVVLLNDADAAGIAEVTFGAGKGRPGVVLLLTFGTGIGSALFLNGKLVPNTELGHLEIRGKDAEERASDRVRSEKGWGWQKWADHLDEYLGRLEALFTPDLFIIGGGVSKQHEHFLPYLHRKTPVVAAQLLNDAGIAGAALAAGVLL